LEAEGPRPLFSATEGSPGLFSGTVNGWEQAWLRAMCRADLFSGTVPVFPFEPGAIRGENLERVGVRAWMAVV